MRACCLWRACEYSMRWIVEGDALDRDDVGCEVEISELEAEQLFAAVSAEDCQHEKDHLAQRLTVKRVEERLCLFYGEDLLLTLLALREHNTRTGILFGHAHPQGIGEHAGDEREVISDGFRVEALGGVFLICSRLRQAGDKLLKLPRGDLVDVEMSRSRIS